MLALLFIPLAPYSARIPTASCAVVLIVGAWQSVKWGKLRAAFASPLTIVLFALSLLITLLTNIAVGTIVSAVIGAILPASKIPQHAGAKQPDKLAERIAQTP